MRRWICILTYFLFTMPMSIFSQNFSTLWNKYTQAQRDDLPKTQIEVLDKIIDQANKENEYGHLLKAELCRMAAVTAITPDSIDAEIAKLEKKEQESAKKTVLAAVYQSVLGNIYKYKHDPEKDVAAISKVFFAKSLSNPTLLASTKAGDFVPLMKEGKDSKFFNNDLLSVLCDQADDYQTLHEYYVKNGNREAACLSACLMVRNTDADQLYGQSQAAIKRAIQKVDSLLAVYGDLEVAGELALLKYDIIEHDNDVKNEEKIQFIEDAKKNWAKWPRIQSLENKKNQLIQPRYSMDFGPIVVLPNTPRTIEFGMIRNLSSISATVTRVEVDPLKSYYLNSEKDLKEVLKAAVPGSKFTVEKQLPAHREFDSFSDSLIIKPLQPGVYLLEIGTNNKQVDIQRSLFYVSDVYVLAQALPNKQWRLVAVSATTGKPLKNAKIRFFKNRNNSVNFQFGKNGELVIPEQTQYSSGNFYATCDKDVYCPRQSYWFERYSYYTVEHERKFTEIFTDRGIYRPGQNVKVALLRFVNYDGLDTQALAGEKVSVTLRDANGKDIETKEVTTDAFGKASLEFHLPETGLTGDFTIYSSDGNKYFRVEEYKRPTFEVEIPQVTDSYANGDTLQVKGHAKTYAGVPVQGAKVEYSIRRTRPVWWWSDESDDDALLLNDTIITDENGDFTMTVPVMMPEGFDEKQGSPYRARFYNIVAEATVTDQAGESHEASMFLPVSNKPKVLMFSLPDKVERDKMQPVKFQLLNASGAEVDGEVTYFIDNSKPLVAKANTPVDIKQEDNLASSGKHTVKAVCEGDTVEHSFVLFSINDKRPCIETHDWFYTTGSSFDENGKPVVVQVGSSDPDTYVFYSVCAGEKVLEQGSFKLNNENQNRKWTYKKEYGNGVLLTYAWVRNGVAYTHRHTISKPMPDKRILLKWETFRDRLTPRQSETWTVRATYPDGSPADAQMVASLYDHSLDQITSNYWYLYERLSAPTPSTRWNVRQENDLGLSGRQFIRTINVPNLDFTRIDPAVFDISSPRFYRHSNRVYDSFSAGMMKSRPMANDALEDGMAVLREVVVADAEMTSNMSMSEEMKFTAPVLKKDEQKKAVEEKGEPALQIRENLDETAAFLPQVMTDENGVMTLSFTLPEAVTTWRFLGLATDRKINHGMLTGETVAQKDVMVIPNVPRFVRVGDNAHVSAKLINTTQHAMSGKAKAEFIDPETEAVVASQIIDFKVEANQTTGLDFLFKPEGEPGLLVCKVMAYGDGFSDGEQHYLPVLSNKELVCRTLPFTQNKMGDLSIQLDRLFPKSVPDGKLTVEYTNNPAWLMVQAMPTLAPGKEENAISQAASYYTNSLGEYLMNLSPVIKTTVMKWREEISNSGSMSSALAKNEELKELLLNETPWVGEADKEESQKRSLVKFFDETTIGLRKAMALDKLKALQNEDGSWSWWEGMSGSIYMTTEVAEMMIRLNRMIQKQEETQDMLDNAYQFMGKRLIEDEKWLRKLQKQGVVVVPSEIDLAILYNMALDGRKLNGDVQKAADYMVGLFEKQNTQLTIFGKARGAVILSHFGKNAKAETYLKSLDEYTVKTEDMGRYYDTNKAYYSWKSYRIPTQVAAIEAYKLLKPEKAGDVDEMRIWLLQQKRAQAWDSPINSIDAIYAFLEGNMQSLTSKVESRLTIDGKEIQTSEATAGLGYVKTEMKAQAKSTFRAEKRSEGTSWGALYAQFMQNTEDVETQQAGLSVTRKIMQDTDNLKVGDKVKVRITVKADRDMDFVEIIDKRAACLEPVSQLSGYQWGGYYVAPKDYTTAYYFDQFQKGTHVIETEYYIDREGTYLSGTCKVQCAYAPEFSATDKAMKIQVKK